MKDAVPEYKSWIPLVRHLFWARIHIAIKLIQMKGGERVLDAGCGTGHLLEELNRKYKGWYGFGVDISPEVANLTLPNCTFLVADICSLSLPNSYFDFVFALDTLEHIRELDRALKEIKRVLKKNGILIVSGPTETFLYRLGRFLCKGTFSQEKGPCAGRHYYNINQIIQKIKENDFKIEVMQNLPSLQPFVLQKILRFKNMKAQNL